MKQLASGCLAALMVATAALVAVASASPAQAQPSSIICDPSGVASSQNEMFVVQNNVTGADSAQCIDVDQNSGFTVVQSDHDNPTSGAPAASPSIYLGCQNGHCSPESFLPFQVGEIDIVTAGVEFSYPTSGAWTAGFRVLLDPTPRTDGQNEAELKILFNQQGSVQPVGSPVGEYTTGLGVGARTWEVWYGNAGRQVITYVSPSPITKLSGWLVLPFVDDAIGRGYLDSSWYMNSVQAGLELWEGGVGLTATSFFGFAGSDIPPPPPPPVPPPPPLPPPPSCSAAPTVHAEWGQGYVVSVAVTNGGDPTSGWAVAFTLPGGHEIVKGWNAQLNDSGDITATNRSHNGDLSRGRVRFGFVASRSDAADPPTTFSCAVT